MELSKCLHCLHLAPNIVPFSFLVFNFFFPDDGHDIFMTGPRITEKKIAGTIIYCTLIRKAHVLVSRFSSIWI